jgi:hypothetical protein
LSTINQSITRSNNTPFVLNDPKSDHGSNSQYAKTGDAIGEKAVEVKLVRITNEVFDNLPGQ